MGYMHAACGICNYLREYGIHMSKNEKNLIAPPQSQMHLCLCL